MRDPFSAAASGQLDIVQRLGVVVTDTVPVETDSGTSEGSRPVPPAAATGTGR